MSYCIPMHCHLVNYSFVMILQPQVIYNLRTFSVGSKHAREMGNIVCALLASSRREIKLYVLICI